MFFATRNLTNIGVLGTSWPDGDSFLDQEAITVQVYDVCMNKVLDYVGAKQNG